MLVNWAGWNRQYHCSSFFRLCRPNCRDLICWKNFLMNWNGSNCFFPLRCCLLLRLLCPMPYLLKCVILLLSSYHQIQFLSLGIGHVQSVPKRACAPVVFNTLNISLNQRNGV